MVEHYHISPDKITVVGTGAGVIKPYYGAKDYLNKKILFAAKGRFEDKGGDLVLQAFDEALKTMPDLKFKYCRAKGLFEIYGSSGHKYLRLFAY